MKTLKTITLCLMGALIIASCSTKSNNPQPKGITASDVDSVSYALGQYFGMMVKMDNFGDLNMNKLIAGMKEIINIDSVDQEKLQMQAQENAQVINKFMEKKMKISQEQSKIEETEFFAKNGKEEGVITTESGVQYKIVRAGNGVKPSATDSVEVNYEGSLLDGTVFDSSYERGESVTFPLNQVIRGWSEGLQYADEGSEITLWIPAELAYGQNAPGSIGPNKTLKFKVELIKVIPVK
ncbi:MAG: FKBP-type peptidyl-prolyl cis-trans isomerase [Bacteroidales bacterium]|nr:FKBP-type peptidyl-prolyl cis-trans isomerase [Bacteroidales bacterium]MDD4669848.1 FKBP-type peptidyl-prolyl cis-trans isomerase [Bacteroidales bacterium]